MSHFRLTAHLALALLIFAAELWIALDLLESKREASRSTFLAIALPALIFLMALTGGFVAGLRAGYTGNSNGAGVANEPREVLLASS